jgi:hypothetical protein
LFVDAITQGEPAKLPGKILVRAPASEKERLGRRAKELFQGAEITAETGDQFLAGSLPLSDELFKLMEKFAESCKGLAAGKKAQSYLLKAGPDGFIIIAGGAPGLYYGLLSLSEFFDRKGAAIELFDSPRFADRGFLQDLSRGQVLTLPGFQRLVSSLAAYRFNYLTFNLEHNFGYAKHPKIWQGDDALTIEEAKALSVLCREYYIEAVPMQQSLGHCRGILSKPEYRDLAFDDKLLWSLDPRKDETYSLLAELYQEQAQCFPGKYFLVGCDEPFDLKKYWKPESAGGKQFTEVYIEHLHKLNKIVKDLGRKMMVWGDIFVAHPELLARAPEDAVIINWQYGTSMLEKEDFYEQKTKAIAESKKEFQVATCTWTYARLFPELKTMEHNNRNFLNAGERLGANGALLTNWGDMGHKQLLGYLAMPIAYFGRNAWKKSGQTLEEFSKDFSLHFFNDPKGVAGEFFILLAKVNEIVSPGPFFGGAALFVLLDDLFSIQYLPNRPLAEVTEDLLQTLKQAAAATASLVSIRNYEWVLDLKPVIYALGALFTKILLKDNASLGLLDPSKKEEILNLFGHLLNYGGSMEEVFKERWLSQAKPLGLERNLARLAKAAQGYQKRKDQIENAAGQTWEKLRDAPEFAEYRFNLMKEMGLEGLL